MMGRSFLTSTSHFNLSRFITKATLRPTRFNLEIRSTRLLIFGRFRTSRIGFWVILPISHGTLRV